MWKGLIVDTLKKKANRRSWPSMVLFHLFCWLIIGLVWLEQGLKYWLKCLLSCCKRGRLFFVFPSKQYLPLYSNTICAFFIIHILTVTFLNTIIWHRWHIRIEDIYHYVLNYSTFVWVIMPSLFMQFLWLYYYLLLYYYLFIYLLLHRKKCSTVIKLLKYFIHDWKIIYFRKK